MYVARPVTPEALETMSPLWPLQQAMRAIFSGAINSGAATSQQAQRVGGVYATVEHWFQQWQKIGATNLRAIIMANIMPPNLDLANDPVLSGFQTALLALTQWSDTLPN